MSDFLNKYPYTDFHELNLDWVIERVKKLTEDWLATQEAWNNTEEQWQQLHDYVMEYFADLDVQDEINNKINAMIADGTFSGIVTPIIENDVAVNTAQWLADNVNPVGSAVTIDKTLTIANSAGDAKIIGDSLGKNVYQQTAASRVISVPLSAEIGDRFYFKPISSNNTNASGAALIGVISGNNETVISTTDFGKEKYYTSTKHYDSFVLGFNGDTPSSPITNTAVFKILNDASLSTAFYKYNENGFKGVLSSGDLNNIFDEGIYFIPTLNTLSNLPAVNFNSLLTVHKDMNGLIVQEIQQINNADNYFIRYIQPSIPYYLSWRTYTFSSSGDFPNNGELAAGDLNNITQSGFYIIPTSNTVANMPSTINFFALLTVFNMGNGIVVQKVEQINDKSKTFIRYIQPGSSYYLTWRTYPGFTGIDIKSTISSGSLASLAGGVYVIASSNSITDLPDVWLPSMNGLLINYTTGSYKNQFIYSINAPFIAMSRYITSGGTISKWVNIGNTTRTNKRLYIIGDSIALGRLGDGSLGKSYIELAAYRSGYNSINNYSIGGLGYVYSRAVPSSEVPWATGTRLRAIDIINHYYNDFEGESTVVLAFGINDWQTLGDSTPIAETDRRATTPLIKTRVQECITTLMSARPNMSIIVLTPLNSSFRGGSQYGGYGLSVSLDNSGDGSEAMTLNDTYNAIYEACQEMGVKCVDMTHMNSVVNFLNINTVLPDKLHPSQICNNLLSDTLII